MLLLPVLHVDENRDEAVLHLLIEVQLVAQGQLLHQLLRVAPDSRLHLLQQLVQLREGQGPHSCTGRERRREREGQREREIERETC